MPCKLGLWYGGAISLAVGGVKMTEVIEGYQQERAAQFSVVFTSFVLRQGIKLGRLYTNVLVQGGS